jgi:hypothetical protein
MSRLTCCLLFSLFHRSPLNPAVCLALCLICSAAASGQTIRIPAIGGLQEFTDQNRLLRPGSVAASARVEPAESVAGKVHIPPRLIQEPVVAGAVDDASGDKGGDSTDKKPEDKSRPVEIVPVIVAPEPLLVPMPDPDAPAQLGERDGFQWRKAYRQSLMFLGIQHSFRLLTEPSTRADLKGPFFRDWFTSICNLRGWRDGDPFLVNYIGHPMQGAVTGYIQIHNDPRGLRQEISRDKAYWKSRFKAFAWSAIYSFQFELGPLSESSIGNVGLKPSDTSKHPQAWVDLVVTPVLGTAWLVGEDALDRWVVRPLERRTSKYPLKILIRSFLNPSRSFANTLRGKWPWYRDYR